MLVAVENDNGLDVQPATEMLLNSASGEGSPGHGSQEEQVMYKGRAAAAAWQWCSYQATNRWSASSSPATSLLFVAANAHSNGHSSNLLAIRQICTSQAWSGIHHGLQTPSFHTTPHPSLCGPCLFCSSPSLAQAQDGCAEKHELG
ncbi:hypothetical protein FIBSPDRAFT_955502 [Athelia psychrophila]|uniref:Uncharacterized protein n=1 Tax=Athelia psychrophila TaxID=1759441 RepID=A0A166HZB7_9AGAM|nr:hypothetical protein FIBSPDRAFT_955502 [Fibularhizoctonia sp. CBS 109695]